MLIKVSPLTSSPLGRRLIESASGMFVDDFGFRYRRLDPDLELALREKIAEEDTISRLCACMHARQATDTFDAKEKGKEGAGEKGKTGQKSACECDCQFWEVL